MKKLLLTCLVGCVLNAAAATDALDGLASWWKFNGSDANANGAADAAETVDLMTLGRASGVRKAKGMTRNFDTGAVVTFQTVDTETPYHGQGATTFQDTFLHFPQPYDAEANTIAKATARLDGALKTSGTIHLKFKWDGGFSASVAPTYCLFANAYEWGSNQGYALYIFGKSGDTSTGTLVIRLGQDPQTSLCDIKKDVWYDLVLKIELKPDVNQTLVDAYLADRQSVFAFNGVTHVQRTLNRAADFSVSTWIGNDITIASETPEDGSLQQFGAGTAKCFKGYVGDFQVFSRLLSETEVYSVLMRAYGSVWSVGAVNGSADEFAGAAGTIAGVAVDDWRAVTHGLSAKGQSLTLASELDANDVGTVKMLVLYPLLVDTTSSSVQVLVNGIPVRQLAISGTRKVIFLDGSVVENGADGKMSVSIVRTDENGGVLAFDAIRLCGSWQIGKQDAYPSSDDFSNCGRVGTHYFPGDPNAKHAARGTEGLYQFSTYNYTFFSPGVEKAKTTFEALVCNVRSGGAEVVEPIGMEIRLNGTLLQTYSPLKRLDSISVELPSAGLVGGLNTVSLKMVNQPQNDCQIYLDYARVIQSAPEAGLSVFIR